MKKVNFKKYVASVAALCVVACALAVPATVLNTPEQVKVAAATATEKDVFPDGNGPLVAIQQVTVEASKAGEWVPVVIKVYNGGGCDAIEFGFEVDEDLDSYGLINSAAALNAGKKATADWNTYYWAEKDEFGDNLLNLASVTVEDTRVYPSAVEANADNAFNWSSWAASAPVTDDLDYLVVLCKIPASAQPGDQYDIKFVKNSSSKNGFFSLNNVDNNAFDGVDGFIKIAGTATTTTTEATTTTTEATTTTTQATTTTTQATTTTTQATTTTTQATTTTTKATTTTTQATTTTTKATTTTTQATTTTAQGKSTIAPFTVPAASSTAATTTKAYVTNPVKATTRARSMNPHIDKYYTQTTAKAVPAATARTSTTGTSPKTGASDVLPIAGAAAAVAVLGGVALVSKKKND